MNGFCLWSGVMNTWKSSRDVWIAKVTILLVIFALALGMPAAALCHPPQFTLCGPPEYGHNMSTGDPTGGERHPPAPYPGGDINVEYLKGDGDLMLRGPSSATIGGSFRGPILIPVPFPGVPGVLNLPVAFDWTQLGFWSRHSGMCK
jgi:hypothetical protein